jgi:hypothetical protein
LAEQGRNQPHKAKLGTVKNDDRADWREAWALFPGDVAYVWHAGRFASTVQESLEACGFDIRAQIIWAKDRFALSRGNYHWQHEPCLYAVKGTAHWTGDRSQSTLWQIPAREDRGHGHGTQKPVECMRRPMLNNSSPGQAVYEPFCGSGTTIIAVETVGRVCQAMEIDPAYVDVVIIRWQAFTGQSAMLEGDGRFFADITAERRGRDPNSEEASADAPTTGPHAPTGRVRPLTPLVPDIAAAGALWRQRRPEWPGRRTDPMRTRAARSRRWQAMACARTRSRSSSASIRRRCASTTDPN